MKVSDLTKEQTDLICNLMTKVMNKYEKKAKEAEFSGDEKASNYYAGVVDGLNNGYKIIMGIEGDYLDGIN